MAKSQQGPSSQIIHGSSCETTDVEENFIGCYMLVSENPSYKGRIYIGFTVDPNRRIKQHNKGAQFGGAKRTSKRGPWNMVLVVHGFPNEVSALRFEWAWQHPTRSRCLHKLSRKKQKETSFQYHFRILSEMLRMGPWNRLPLTIRWLDREFHVEFQAALHPPLHMPIVFGPVVPKHVSIIHETDEEQSSSDESSDKEILLCSICKREVKDKTDLIRCLVPTCSMEAHLSCLADHFLSADTDYIIPVKGTCPLCKTALLWGDLIRHRQGCYKDIAVEDFHVEFDSDSETSESSETT